MLRSKKTMHRDLDEHFYRSNPVTLSIYNKATSHTHQQSTEQDTGLSLTRRFWSTTKRKPDKVGMGFVSSLRMA